MRTPPDPLNGYADRWQKKIGRAKGPVRIRSRTVPRPRAQANIQTAAAMAEPKGDCRFA